MARRVVFRPRAQLDIAAALTRQGRSRAAADRWRQGLVMTVVAALEADPHRYPEADEAAALGADLRILIYGRRRNVYRVLFTIDEPVVNVVRVRHAAQDALTADDL